MKTYKSSCILCDSNCGLELEVDGREIKKIKPDKSHPASKGYLCQKSGRLNYYQNHNQRLTHPLKRKPDGSFEKIDWDRALGEIAEKLIRIRDTSGGHSFAFYGGGGQGNHLQSINSSALRKMMGSRYIYSSLAQEKTGDFWVAGEMFGRQDCHLTADGLEHADLAIFWGTNPYMAHGFPRARNILNEISKSSTRRMVVIDPKRSKTAEMADLHIAIKPGTDAFLLTAILSLLIQNGGIDSKFIEKWTVSWDKVQEYLDKVNIEAYCQKAEVKLEEAKTLASWIKETEKITFRHDLGLEQSPHSTLNSYLEKLMILVTGSFGKEGCNTFHTSLIPLLTHSEPESDGKYKYETKVTGMFPISGMYPPNILASEIDTEHPERLRALWVDSSNPISSAADTAALIKAFSKLELLVTVDVAMTETARLSHYVLPAASQFEKWEASSFNFSFPENYFYLRKPIFEPLEESLSESEIYERLLLKMGEKPLPVLSQEKFPHLERKVRLALYPLYMLVRRFASANKDVVLAAGHKQGDYETLGDALFVAILEGPTAFSLNKYEDNFSKRWLKHEDGKFHLYNKLMLEELNKLNDELEVNTDKPEMLLMAGERRSYTANVIFRDPNWRRSDLEGSLHIHPEDAVKFGLLDKGKAICSTRAGEIEVFVEFNENCRKGACSLPNGYGAIYPVDGNGEEIQQGPYLNFLTSAKHCDEFSKTPLHKHVPVNLRPI
ncbi:MAG: molybdopterin-dependent oxidoreductase [Leptospiraceae bacterium]|nr:molybdopterin-dependent oxidoreductase [Leptospiraceae bacterium]